MTRGYVCITEGKNVSKVAYLNSDAYLSWYGKKILDAAHDNKINEWIDAQHSDNIASYGKNDDPCKGFQLNWIKPDAQSKTEKDWSYAGYGYIFNRKTDTLQVYHRGKRLFAIHLDDPTEYNKFAYLFEYEDEIWSVGTYEPDRLGYTDESFDSFMRSVSKNSVDMMKLLVDRYSEKRVYLTDTHCIAPGHSAEAPCYRKILSSNKDESHVDFIIQKERYVTRNAWCVLVQTPFCRVPIGISASSEKAAMRSLRELIKRVTPDKFFRLGSIFSRYDKCKSSTKLLNDLYNELTNMWAEKPWYTTMSSLSVDWIKHALYIRINALKKMEA